MDTRTILLFLWRLIRDPSQDKKPETDFHKDGEPSALGTIADYPIR